MKLDKEEQIVFEFTRQDLPGAYQEDLAWKIPWTEEPGRLHAVHGVAKSRTRLSDFTFTFYFHALEKEMATHSNVLAWRIPGTEEPGGLRSMGSHGVGHDWRDLAAVAAAAGKISRRYIDKGQPLEGAIAPLCKALLGCYPAYLLKRSRWEIPKTLTLSLYLSVSLSVYIYK